MPSNLAFPPVRVPIGQFTDAQGRTYDVLMTPEFARALSSLMTRVGGPASFNMDEVLAFAGSQDSSAAQVAALRGQVADLEAQLAAATAMNARLAKLERQMQDLATLAHAASPAPVDWEHPGKLGNAAPNSAKVTTLVTTGKTQLNPAGTDVELKPTGAGKVVISPATAGAMDNVVIGGATPAAATFSTVTTTATVAVGNATNNGATLSPTVWERGYSTVPQMRYITNHVAGGMLGWGSDGAGAMIFGLATGQTGAVSDTWLTMTGGGAAIKGGFGCNGKSAQYAYALGAAATDLATVIALANNLRTMAINNGTGS